MSGTPSNVSAFAGLVDLASAELGAVAVLCSDDFFAEKENLIKPKPAIFLPDEYTDRGKWMDGWESRRKRVPGHDWCIVKLGVAGVIRGVDIDTAFFMGNHPPFASLEACFAPDASPSELTDAVEWTEVLPQIALQRGSHNLAGIASRGVYSHVRLRIFPDGGVARLRVYGEPDARESDGEIDLLALANGGRALACSDMFFSPMNNLLLPHRAVDMGGGWETRRSRPPGQDWVILALGKAGDIARIEVDTHHFKGNFPDRCAIDAIHWPGAPPATLIGTTLWTEILPPTKLRADMAHVFPVDPRGPCTHLRLRVLPDGGVSRLRAWGTASTAAPGAHDPLVRHLNELSEGAAAQALAACCGSRRWVARMAAARPFASRTHLLGTADAIWWSLADADWREAFAHHPKIGADPAALRAKYASTAAWAAAEQAAVQSADDTVIHDLAAANEAYEARFGFIFIVCATGKTAPQMLALLHERESNAPEAEIRVAAGEQAKITAIRLEKLA